MAKPQNNGNTGKPPPDFRISNGPLERFGATGNRPFDLPDVIDLPPLTGGPLLFAVARDPRTIFTYWNIDWLSVFGNGKPVDRQAHLRVVRGEAQESSTAVEPMAGNHYLKVAAGGTYRVEIGYYQPEENWHSVATSEEVTMPVEGVAENVELDLATIPFHLSFQRLIDLFRAQNGDALAEIISRLQRRAVSDQERDLLSSEEWEILRAMNLSLDELGAARRALLDSRGTDKLRQQAEAILGFGSTSPARAFGGSSWS
jgi:hypothetical protein